MTVGHKKNIVCKYFLKGMCQRGMFCRYDHVINTQNIRDRNGNKVTDKINMSAQISKGRFDGYMRRDLNSRNTRQCKFMDRCFKFPNCGYEHKEVCK